MDIISYSIDKYKMRAQNFVAFLSYISLLI